MESNDDRNSDLNIAQALWNINDDRYSNFSHFYEKKSSDFGHFCRDISWIFVIFKMWRRLYIFQN